MQEPVVPGALPKMKSERAEKLATLFLAVFSTGLVAQLASVGALQQERWLGAALATLGSVGLAVGVRLWPRPAQAAARPRDD
jgi:hypothetical protein